MAAFSAGCSKDLSYCIRSEHPKILSSRAVVLLKVKYRIFWLLIELATEFCNTARPHSWEEPWISSKNKRLLVDQIEWRKTTKGITGLVQTNGLGPQTTSKVPKLLLELFFHRLNITAEIRRLQALPFFVSEIMHKSPFSRLFDRSFLTFCRR